MKIEELQPREVFRYFEQIAAIPHGSGNTAALSAYCMRFAQRHGLRAHQDEIGNVVIFADGTAGYEKSETLILQGHLDMVCDKAAGCELDMAREAITLCTDGSYVWADGTTLGGDDGIAVAFMLAILASDTVAHPPLEALFTVDEEIGMLGAQALDARLLRGRRLINLDSETEGVLTTSCAGGVRAHGNIPLTFVETEEGMLAFQIAIGGLRGGHSGIDIGKNRGNALKILSRLLEYVGSRCTLSVAELLGGGKDNAIPKTAQATVCVSANEEAALTRAVAKFYEILKAELVTAEPSITVTLQPTVLPARCTDSAGTHKLVFALMQVPNGIQTMSPDIPGMVQTSLNLGTAMLEEERLTMCFLLRSNAAAGKQAIIQKLNAFIDYIDGKVVFTSDYPAWEYRIVSPLRERVIETYREVYADMPLVTAIHAGLECGILAGKVEDLDMISFGPNLENVHTPNERMEVASVERCWRFLVQVLKNLRETPFEP